MESGDSAAGYGSEQNREQQLYAVAVVNRKAGYSREQFRIDIGMSAYNADDGYDQHGIQQEGAQVVTGLQQDPDRGYGSNGDINTDNPHPGTGGEVERMEVHADCHARPEWKKSPWKHDGGIRQNRIR